ncbi:MAG: GNAT family N-acetyltransferase [Butyrivibrio sp.]|nr:GNAT family N-acetyltransferase [Butyrivibrio sp.]
MNQVFEQLQDSITGITKENIDAFETLLDPDIYEEIEVGKSLGIGVVQEGTAAGVAAYGLDTEPLDGGKILRIKYFMIHSDCRLEGLGDELMAALIAAANEAGADIVAVSFQKDLEDLRGFLEGWGFLLEDGISPEIALSLKDVKNHRLLMENSMGVKALIDEESGDDRRLIKRCFRIWGYSGFLNNTALLSDYLDMDLSCYMGTKEAPLALLLVHRTPKGKVVVEYLNSADPGSEDEIMLLSYVCYEAMGKYGNKTLITVKPDTMEFILNLDADQLFKKHLLLNITEGILFLDQDEK